MTLATIPVEWTGTVIAGVPAPVPRAEQTLDSVKWRKMQDAPDGVIGDLTGAAFALTATTGDGLTLGLGKYRVDGFIIEVTVAHALTLAAVSVDTIYHINLLLDPALYSAVGGAGTVAVGAGTAPAAPSGGRSVPLWQVTRKNGQTLATSIAAASRRFPWVADSGVIGSAVMLGSDAVGARRFVQDESRDYHRIYASGVVAWAPGRPRIEGRKAAVTFSAGSGTMSFSPALPFVPTVITVSATAGATPFIIEPGGTASKTSVLLKAWTLSAATPTPYTGNLGEVQIIAYTP